jgi:abortive infection bacteriophage resistance protein
MIVSDDALAQAFLGKIGYYRLSGYWYPYRQSTTSNDFRAGTKFSEIVDLYVFDKKLRLLMMDVIERIEIALRVQITLQLGRYSAHAHRDADLLHANFSVRPDHNGQVQHQKWLRRHDEAFDRSKEEFAKHFKTKYAEKTSDMDSSGTLGLRRYVSPLFGNEKARSNSGSSGIWHFLFRDNEQLASMHKRRSQHLRTSQPILE